MMIDHVDPFNDIRDKRIGDLTEEQKDRAIELWLRTQIGPRETYWYPHLQALFRIIDRLRMRQPAPSAEPNGYEAITPVYTRYVSPERYAKFSPAVQRWYRPYWIGTQPAGERKDD